MVCGSFARSIALSASDRGGHFGSGHFAAPALPHLGPRKLRVVLERQAPETCWPAASTIGDILQRAGLITPVKRRRPALDGRRSVTAVTAANDEWAADFKGWFRAGDNSRIDPLTLTDSHSRYLIEVWIVPPTIERSQPVLRRRSRRQGLPCAIRCDDGSPFGSTGAGGLTRLSAWWIKLGIEPHFIHPASPGEWSPRAHASHPQGPDPRPPAANAAEQQERFDTFRRHYNGKSGRMEARPTTAARGLHAIAAGDAGSHRGALVRCRSPGPARAQFGRDLVERRARLRHRGADRRTGRHRRTRNRRSCGAICHRDIGLIDCHGRFRRFAPPRFGLCEADTGSFVGTANIRRERSTVP